MSSDTNVDLVLRCIELCPSLKDTHGGLHRIGTWCTLRALIERAGKPALEALAADRPVFLMAIHVEAGITNVIAVVKQLYNRRQLDQDVGLLLFQCDERLGLFSLFLRRRCCRRFPDRSVFALLNQSCATGIALKPVRHITFWRKAWQTDDAHTCGNMIKGPRNPL